MNATIAMLTLRTLLGRRRALLLLVLPGVLVALAVVLRLTVDEASRVDVTVGLLGTFAIATVIPLLALIAGTGALGGEIDDGSIVYLLSKPISRHTIVVTKVAVAVGVTTLFGAVPVLVSGWIMVGNRESIAVAYGLGAFAAATAYCALFLLLSVLNRNAVVIGLIYTLVWETAIGGLVLGAGRHQHPAVVARHHPRGRRRQRRGARDHRRCPAADLGDHAAGGRDRRHLVRRAPASLAPAHVGRVAERRGDRSRGRRPPDVRPDRARLRPRDR